MSGSGNKKSSSGDVLKEDEVTLAVVIADSYDNSLKPCTLDRSRVLVPLANKPLIDYTLAFLSLSGIDEAIVYCTSYARQIKSYIHSSKWPSLMKVSVIINEDAQNVGDALRDLDDKKLISADFVLVHGDLVANLDIKACLVIHQKTRAEDKDAILTKVMKKCPPGHRTRSSGKMTLYALNKSTNQILAQRKVGSGSKVRLPTELVRESKGQLELRCDLLDCHVTVCAAMVPSLLTDNFDYQNIDDLVHGVLGNQEILGNTMHVHVLEEGYAARASDFSSYVTVSRDVIDKWAYPFCSDRAWSSTKDTPADVNYGNKYIVSSKKFSRKCQLKNNIVVGDNTRIGDKTVIKNSVIGRDCVIGADVSITDSYIWAGSIVEDRCEVSNSLLCEGVTLYQNTKLLPPESGAGLAEGLRYVLGKQVKLGPDVVYKGGVDTDPFMLVNEVPHNEWDDGDDAVDADFDAGSKGQAFPFKLSSDDESDDSDDDIDDVSADGDQFDDDLITPDTELFYKEVLDTLRRASTENISAENIILDINSLKHAYNIQINEVNHMLIQAVLDRPVKADTTPAQLLIILKPLLKLCIGVFKNYYRSEKSQNECLQAVQELLSDDAHKLCMPIICQVLMYFYQNDILDEEVIVSWYEDSLPEGRLKTEVSKLVEWFSNADSDSESD